MTQDLQARVKATIRDIPDFPKPPVLFRDITPVLQDGALFAEIIEHFRARYADAGVTAIVGIESRGFIFGAPLAVALGVGFVLVRKPGKLPAETIGADYALEYGTDRLEMHSDALGEEDNVVLIDDLLATGGTASATVSLIEQLGATIHEVSFLTELGFLEGRLKLPGTPVYALIKY